MWIYAKRGWSSAWRSWFLLLLLFLYQYAWGTLLFKYVKQTVVPLLHRYPGEALSEGASRLFWLEAQFQIIKTDAAMPYLWTLAAFLAARMLLTPLINAGIYNAICDRNEGERKSFFKGVRKFAKPFLFLYLLQTLLAVSPLLWLIPRGFGVANAANGWAELSAGVLPWAVGWLIYQGILELVFMFVGFGIVSGRSVWASLGVFVRSAIQACGLGLIVFAVTFSVGCLVASASLYWAGLLAVTVHQAFSLVRTLLKLWGIHAQYQLWSAKQGAR